MLLIPETVNLANGPLTELQVRTLLEGYNAGTRHASHSSDKWAEMIALILLAFVLAWVIASRCFQPRAEIAELQEVLPATCPLPEEDPFLEACLAMEEGRCDENVQGQLKSQRAIFACENRVMQRDRKELKNPCVLSKERIRRGQCQHVVKQATVASETVMMRNFSSSTIRCPDTKLISAPVPAGAASYKLLACQSQLVMYGDLLGAAGPVNVGRSLQEALVKSWLLFDILARASHCLYRLWSHAGFTRILEASQRNCLRNLGLLDWLGAVDRGCVRWVKFL
eukprot:Skav214474  [mRNA]  locus=scaffold1167:183618:184560:+ [translate_table: standard]